MKNKQVLKNWTKEKVQKSLDEYNYFLLENHILVQVLRNAFEAYSAYCLSFLPIDVDIYEILINGRLIVNLEFDRVENTTSVKSTIPIDHYIQQLNDEQGKKYFRIAKELASKNTNI